MGLPRFQWHGMCLSASVQIHVGPETMPFTFNDAFGIHDSALALRAYRAELLAGNLANADTPNYKARDIAFKTVLDQIGTPGSFPGLATTHARHLATGSTGIWGVEPGYRIPDQAAVDGNTVDTHVEKAVFLENALRYQASLTFLGGRIRSIRAAVRQE